MDLVASARHLRAPFLFTDPDAARRLPIGARGLIGDGMTAALVAVDGAVDWLCLPRFDGPSVFARILDFDRGGSMAVRPAATAFSSLQAYDPDTNVLETLFETGEGAVRLVDSMPWSDDPRASIAELHRRIDGASGRVEIEIVFDPRFDYAREVPRIELAASGPVAEGRGGERLSLSTSVPLSWAHLPGGGVRATHVVTAGPPLWAILSWGPTGMEPTPAHRPFEHLRATRRHWRAWAGKLAYDGPFRHQVLRSALTLKQLIYAPTGAMVAAPTTSLPEWPGGERNWDYRYTWARDAAMAIRAANLLGYGSEARDFYHFLRDTIDPAEGLELMVTIDGAKVPVEASLPHLSGALGSRPVRIGNGARDQLQLDTTGAVIDAAHLYEAFGGTLTRRSWHKIASILDRAQREWSSPDHGIWEPRQGMRHNVHSKLMNWLALDRGAQLAASFGQRERAAQWATSAREVHEDVCRRGVSADGRRFVSVYGEERPDATLLLLPIHGFLPDGDPRLAATVDWVRAELGAGPYLHRYRDDDGVGGAEGAFLLCGFWLAEALALSGRVDEALEVFSAHAEAGNHLGLLSEEIDPTSRAPLGNFPQAFSHLGLVNAALRIDLALRLRDEGSSRGPHLVGPLLRH